MFKKLEETMHVHICKTSFSRLHCLLMYFNFFSKFFPKFKFPNSGCGLSASAAYTPVFMVVILFHL